MGEAVLLREEPSVGSPGQVYSHWQLARGATAFVHSLTPTHHTVFARFPDAADRVLWKAERLIPLFPGWEVAHTFCVDGWGLSFKGRSRAEVMARVNEVIERREFHG